MFDNLSGPNNWQHAISMLHWLAGSIHTGEEEAGELDVIAEAEPNSSPIEPYLPEIERFAVEIYNNFSGEMLDDLQNHIPTLAMVPERIEELKKQKRAERESLEVTFENLKTIEAKEKAIKQFWENFDQIKKENEILEAEIETLEIEIDSITQNMKIMEVSF